MAKRFQLRRDTTANWASANPTLASGEIGIETDSAKRVKIGDGSTAWNSLASYDAATATLAAHATALATPRLIYGASFDGSADVTAPIADSFLQTIATAGKVSNSATTATANNTVSAIVARDASGDFTARNITATLFNGPAASANAVAVANVTGLLSGGKILSSLLPAIAITDTFVVASQVAMLALTAETGDVAVRSDLNKSFILKGYRPDRPCQLAGTADPTDAVLSVAGRTGAVTLDLVGYHRRDVGEHGESHRHSRRQRQLRWQRHYRRDGHRGQSQHHAERLGAGADSQRGGAEHRLSHQRLQPRRQW
jgi:hypothetical protein